MKCSILEKTAESEVSVSDSLKGSVPLKGQTSYESANNAWNIVSQ